MEREEGSKDQIMEDEKQASLSQVQTRMGEEIPSK